MSPDPISVAIALGSNLGNRERYLREAVATLTDFVTSLRVSAFLETDPVEVGPQPRFLNAVVVGETQLSAHGLLTTLLDVEKRFGRERSHTGVPRTLDLDLILYGNIIIDEAGLCVPHPRFRERRFVLEPLAEIAGSWVDPVTGRIVRELLKALSATPHARQHHRLGLV